MKNWLADLLSHFLKEVTHPWFYVRIFHIDVEQVWDKVNHFVSVHLTSNGFMHSFTYKYLTVADSKFHKVIPPFALPVANKLYSSTFNTSKHFVSEPGGRS